MFAVKVSCHVISGPPGQNVIEYLDLLKYMDLYTNSASIWLHGFDLDKYLAQEQRLENLFKLAVVFSFIMCNIAVKFIIVVLIFSDYIFC